MTGFYVDQKAWDIAPDPGYAENPPDSWEECVCCECFHPPDY